MSAYLSGNYAPVQDEATVDDLEVEGRIPEALSGRYVRTGPNPFGEAPQPYHWFVGDGMVHGIHLRDGRAVSYRNRWVRTGAEVEGPQQPFYDLSNTNVLPFLGELLSLTEGCYPYVLSPELETLRRWDVGAPLPHGLTAHPKVDPERGELVGFSYWFEAPYLLYHVVDSSGRLATSEPIELPAPVSMHDFAITRNHVLFFDQPAVFDLEAMATTGFPFAWHPENGARVGVLPRDGGDIRWYETELGYCFHPMNAYEDDDGTIVVDVPMQDSVYRNDIFDKAGPRLERWTIEPSSGKVRQELVDDAPQEFCRVNDSRLGSPHRFGYTIGVGLDMPYEDTRVYKHDFRAGTREVHDFGPGRHPGEFVFVGDPDRGDEEDGGWLLGFVHDDASNRTSLVVLDAQDVPGAPVATVHVPRRIPYGFHGTWVPEA